MHQLTLRLWLNARQTHKLKAIGGWSQLFTQSLGLDSTKDRLSSRRCACIWALTSLIDDSLLAIFWGETFKGKQEDHQKTMDEIKKGILFSMCLKSGHRVHCIFVSAPVLRRDMRNKCCDFFCRKCYATSQDKIRADWARWERTGRMWHT